MPRILFVKTSSLGDVVHQCPAVSDAARGIPEARIDWVVEDAFAGVARMHPRVERVIPVAVRRWRTAPWRPEEWREMSAFRASRKYERYDAAIAPQRLRSGALITCLSSGPRHGMDRTSARERLAARFYDHRHFVPRELHAVERNRRLTAAALGIALPSAIEYGLKAGAAPTEKLPASYRSEEHTSELQSLRHLVC